MATLDQQQTNYRDSFEGWAFSDPYATVAAASAAQSFTPSSTNNIDKIEVYLKKNGSPGGNVTLGIYSDNSGVPGSLLVSANSIAVSSISSSEPTLCTFNFSTAYQLTASTKYWFVLRTTEDTNGVAYVYAYGVDTTYSADQTIDEYTGGNFLSNQGPEATPNWMSWDTDGTGPYLDLYFKEYYSVSSVSLSASLSPSLSVSLSPSASEGSSPSLSFSLSPSTTPSSSISPTPSSSESLSESLSPSASLSESVSISPSPSPAFECDQTQLTAEEMNTPGITNANGGAWAYGQSFVPSTEYPVGKVQVKVMRSADITGSLRLLVMSSLNGNPLSIIDTSNNTYDIATFDEDTVKILDFHFNHDVFLVPGRTYFIVLDGVDIVAPFAGVVKILGKDAYSAEQDAYTSGKLMYTEAFDGINDTWVNAAGGDEGTAWWADMYFKVCYDVLAWSTSPSVSISPSPSSSVSPSLTPSASISPSFSPSSSVSVSPSRSQYEDKYTVKSTVYTNKYKQW